MALMIRGFRVMVSPTGKKKLLSIKVFKKWTNEEVANAIFDHDIFSAKEWKKFLHTAKTDAGKYLPRFTEDGEPIAYQVYFWGAPNWIKEAYNKGGEQVGYISLFPGLDPQGEKRDIAEHGVLRKI